MFFRLISAIADTRCKQTLLFTSRAPVSQEKNAKIRCFKIAKRYLIISCSLWNLHKLCVLSKESYLLNSPITCLYCCEIVNSLFVKFILFCSLWILDQNVRPLCNSFPYRCTISIILVRPTYSRRSLSHRFSLSKRSLRSLFSGHWSVFWVKILPTYQYLCISVKWSG